MTAFLQLAIVLAILLFSAKAAGYLTTKIGQPSVLGELLVGVILGPSLINIIHLPFITSHEIGSIVKELGEIGVLLLMFLAGLELHLNELVQNKKASALGGVFGVVLPILFGFLIGTFYEYGFEQSMFLGLTLGATSVSISAQTLIELKALRSRVGLGLLGAAVIDDMLVILVLSTFLALQSGGNALQIIFVFLKMVAFLAGSVAFGLWILPRISRYVSRLPISQGLVTLSLIIMLVYGVSAELFGGMAAITGAFIAGLMFSRTREKVEIERGLRAVAYSFFVPIFFVNIGLSVNIRDLDISALIVMLVISVAAILGKLIGSGLGAKLGDFSWRESLQLGIGMVSRGEVGLIVAAVGLEAGLISPNLFSAIIGMVLITTLVTPPMLRASFAKPATPLQPPANIA
jgi:Kef-type K+ transport system membrane component KefB